jgi:predicted SAM-dependent methyltransferase
MFFDKLELWSEFRNAEIIHFAPEKNLSTKIEQCLPLNYIRADLYPSGNNIRKIDLTRIPFKDESFDIFICNHVLEHITDYRTALKEIYRVLKPDGTAILQTPFSKLLQDNFEDEGINTDELRLLYYGQEDHVRIFSENRLFQSLTDAGFKLQIARHNDLFEGNLAEYYGVNEKEDLIRVIKPGNIYYLHE